jgi:outer membrane protein OmpU
VETYNTFSFENIIKRRYVMRKLLLGTTALAAAASLSANVALAEVSFSGGMEFTYEDHDPGSATTGASNNDFNSDQNIVIKFEKKTDSGLTLGMVQNIESIGEEAVGTAASDENYIYIKGGFGTIELGNNDGAGDQLTRTASDLVGPDALSDNGAGMTGSGNLADDNADLILDINDQNNITYILPTMGGLTIGASYADGGQGASENDDITTVGLKYAFESGAVKGTLHYGQSTIDSTTSGGVSRDSNSIGLDVSSGPFRAVIAKGEADTTTSGVTTEVTDYGVQYNVGGGLTLAAVGTQIEENTGGETSDITTVSAKYNITSGLDAYLTYHDYDYAAGTSGGTADDGSKTYITIKASF